jgi:hypothetical protein
MPCVEYCMTSSLFHCLEAVLSAKRRRLSITRSPRSREVLRREIRQIKHRLDELLGKQR